MVLVQLYSTSLVKTHVVNLVGRYTARILDIQYIDTGAAKSTIRLQSSVMNFRNSTTNSFYFANAADHVVYQTGSNPEIDMTINNVIDITLSYADGSGITNFTSYVITLDLIPLDTHPEYPVGYSIQDYRQ